MYMAHYVLRDGNLNGNVGMRKQTYDKYTLLEIRWQDIVERSGWHKVTDASSAECMKILTVGYFISNHNNCLNIASTISKDEECNVTTIPWGVIYSVKELEYADGSDC